MQIITKRGYTLLDCASILQKAIRRGDHKIAGYFAQELVASGYHNYVWKRLLTISAEDVIGIITQEIKALHDSFLLINQGNKKDKIKGRIFISKAVIILSQAVKSREPDHLQCLVYDRKIAITDQEIMSEILDLDIADRVEIPDYAWDVHTKKGRQMGKTKKDFFIAEQKALFPRQPMLFDDLPDQL